MAQPPRRPSPPRQQSTTPHYQTFPTKPPTSRGKPPRPNAFRSDTMASSHADSEQSLTTHDSPLPKGQLCILAIIALAEQTALNSISPYLPDMAATFPGVGEGQVGMYVGLIASSFALAQFVTSFFWGYLSDRIGRKPVVLIGTFLTAAGFVAFGFCRTLWQAILVQVFIGLSNGNQAIISTCLGEITDRTNQSKAFTYLPVIYGIGGITGPALGGLLVERTAMFKNYPYAPPNLVSAAVLGVDLIIIMIFLEESLETMKDSPPLGERVGNLFARMWQFTSSSQRPTYLHRGGSSQEARATAPLLGTPQDHDDDVSDEDEASHDDTIDDDHEHTFRRDVLNRDMILILITFLIFQLSNISYNSLYPIFAAAQPPVGRGLKPSEIGITLAFAGLITIVFQVGLFGKLREKFGNKATYRAGLAGFVLAFLLMPFVAYKHKGDGIGSLGYGNVWLFTELGVILIIKTVASVGFLTSALLMITNSASNHSVLGTLNGLAQTLSAGGRAVGPFLSGSLFSASTRLHHPKAEALAFGVFGGIALVGFLLSFGIKGEKLEADGESDSSSESEDSADEETLVGSRK